MTYVTTPIITYVGGNKMEISKGTELSEIEVALKIEQRLCLALFYFLDQISVILPKNSDVILWNSSATPKFFLSRKRELTNGEKVRILMPSSSGNCYEQDTTSPQHRFQKAVGCARRQQGAGRLSPASSFGKSGFL